MKLALAVAVVNQEFKDEDPSLENQREQLCECKPSSVLYSARYIQHYPTEEVGGGGKGIFDMTSKVSLATGPI